jgi:hypothetical protein
MAAHAISPTLYARLPFNARTDFSFGRRADRALPQEPRQVFLRLGRLGRLGTTLHLSGELFKVLAKVDIQHVPYRGSAPATQDLLAGRIHMMFDNIPGTLTQSRAGVERLSELSRKALESEDLRAQYADLATTAWWSPPADTLASGMRRKRVSRRLSRRRERV